MVRAYGVYYARTQTQGRYVHDTANIKPAYELHDKYNSYYA